MKTAVVTGASGFVGSYLVKELVANDYHVYAMVRPGTLNSNRLEGVKSLTLVPCDLKNLESLPKYISGSTDYFFHLAWCGVSGTDQSNYEIQLDNVHASLLAMDVAKQLGCTRFVGAGSIAEFECKKELEQCTEIRNQSNSYKVAKLAAHYYCKLKASSIGMDFLWPHLTNAYGAGEFSARLVNSVIRKLLRGEEPILTKADQLYDFIYVTDAARAFRLVAEKGISYQRYIIGSGKVQLLRNYLEELRDVVSPDASLGFNKHPYTGVYLDQKELFSETLYRDTGFLTDVSFGEGIRLTTQSICEQEQNISEISHT